MTQPSAMLTLILTAMAAGGCASPLSYGGRPALPAPQTISSIEYGVRTLTLNYGLPGRVRSPSLISWEKIEILDDGQRVCPVRAVNLGKGDEGHWISVSFMFAPEAKQIAATFVLRIDNDSYPLAATLTRVDREHWRADYGIIPPGR